MFISKNAIGTLSCYICNCINTEDKDVKEKLEAILNERLLFYINLTGSLDIDEEFFISDILHYVGITYFYYEGIKKQSGFKSFIEHVKKRPVLAVIVTKDIEKRLRGFQCMQGNKEFVYFIYKDNSFYAIGNCTCEKISLIKLKKLYFSDYRILSNACFMGNKSDEKRVYESIKRNRRFEEDTAECFINLSGRTVQADMPEQLLKE